MARRFAEQEAARLILLDIDAEALQAAAASIRTSSIIVSEIIADLSDEKSLQQAISLLGMEEIDILINNAGIVVGKAFSTHTFEEIDNSMLVNVIAPMKLTRALLPKMIESGKGHVVNISSAAAMLANPGMSVYCSTKWALSGWSDSLRLEMERQNTGVKVLTVTPYYIDTGMFHGVRSPVIPLIKPETAVRKILRAIEKEKIILRMPDIIYLLPLLKGILPQRWLDIAVGKLFGIYDSMNTFKGRKG